MVSDEIRKNIYILFSSLSRNYSILSGTNILTLYFYNKTPFTTYISNKLHPRGTFLLAPLWVNVSIWNQHSTQCFHYGLHNLGQPSSTATNGLMQFYTHFSTNKYDLKTSLYRLDSLLNWYLLIGVNYSWSEETTNHHIKFKLDHITMPARTLCQITLGSLTYINTSLS